MSNHASAHPVYARYEDFLAADPRRQRDAYELGIDWTDGHARYRACWYQETGELTSERLSDHEPLDTEDFHRGVTGPVEVLRRIPTRGELTLLLGEWPNIAVGQPRSLQWLKALVAGERSDPATRPLDQQAPYPPA